MINVAIVEDEQEAVEYLSDCLHRYGEKTGETFSFTHFPEPITFLEKYKPVYDLVFMDIRMPMMDGMQAAKKLREADTSVLLVFVTRMGDYAIQGYDVGATAFIKKPISYFDFEMNDEADHLQHSAAGQPSHHNCQWHRCSPRSCAGSDVYRGIRASLYLSHLRPSCRGAELSVQAVRGAGALSFYDVQQLLSGESALYPLHQGPYCDSGAG